MTRSDLAKQIAKLNNHLSSRDAELIVRVILEYISRQLANGERIEIRDFGSFCLHYRAPRKAHNPKTGEVFFLECKHVPYFKMGKELREQINQQLWGKKPKEYRGNRLQ